MTLVERLEQRVLDMEIAAHPPLREGSGTNGTHPSGGSGHEIANGLEGASIAGSAAETDAGTPAASENGRTITSLMGKGQTLLKLDQPEAALACFDEVLALDPGNTDALVKKGAALERLQRLNEAVDCYDRAIAADHSMTMAYLYKGGVFNRMERYTEALECYEHALNDPGQAGQIPTVMMS